MVERRLMAETWVRSLQLLVFYIFAIKTMRKVERTVIAQRGEQRTYVHRYRFKSCLLFFYIFAKNACSLLGRQRKESAMLMDRTAEELRWYEEEKARYFDGLLEAIKDAEDQGFWTIAQQLQATYDYEKEWYDFLHG